MDVLDETLCLAAAGVSVLVVRHPNFAPSLRWGTLTRLTTCLLVPRMWSIIGLQALDQAEAATHRGHPTLVSTLRSDDGQVSTLLSPRELTFNG
jgi:hypothetical protein